VLADGYGAPSVLKSIYDHDAGPFLDALRQRGFVVFDDVRTPYNQTLLVVSSVMSGSAVRPRRKDRTDDEFRRDMGDAVRQGAVISVLKDAGYHIIWSKSGYAFLDFPDEEQTEADRPWLTPLEAAIAGSFLPYLQGANHNAYLKASFAPRKLNRSPKPYYYFQHVLAPHPPHTLYSNGSYRRPLSTQIADGSGVIQNSPARRKNYIEGYADKVKFVEASFIKEFDALPQGPKIVIFHGDHGPGAYLAHNSASQTCISERMKTFLAIYTNDLKIRNELELYSNSKFNIVNIYRLLFSILSRESITLIDPAPEFYGWRGLDRPQMTVIEPDFLVPSCAS
jgi:hypothetical protein